MTKAMTLRLPSDKAAEIEAIARIDGITVTDEIRHAIDARIEQRTNDPEFQERLRRIREQDAEILERLSRT